MTLPAYQDAAFLFVSLILSRINIADQNRVTPSLKRVQRGRCFRESPSSTRDVWMWSTEASAVSGAIYSLQVGEED